MDFFAQQDQARRNTKGLVFLFILAVMGVIAALYFLFATLLVYESYDAFQESQPLGYWQPATLLYTAVVTLGIVGLVSLVKVFRLRDGGSAVAELMGARLIAPGATGVEERRLLNVVEEMSLASGLPVPSVYLMDDTSINAFAAGYSMDDAAVVVTRGCLASLTRDELQGVIAHEFSHVIYGDMRLNIRLMGILAGLMFIGSIGRFILRAGSSGRKSNGGAVAVGLIIMLIGGIGVLFGRLIQSAVSRQREFLADASAVQYTRNPHGIAGALNKILSGSMGSEVSTSNAGEISHMFFANGLSGWGFSMFATHPPLEERIQRLGADITSESTPKAPGKVSLPPNATSGLTTSPQSGATTVSALAPLAVVNAVGQVTPAGMEQSRILIDGLPAKLVDAARTPLGAVALIYGLLLDPTDEDTNQTQRRIVRDLATPAVLAELAMLLGSIADLNPAQRLPLVSMTAPALRELVPSQRKRFVQISKSLVQADAKVCVFEFCLQRFVDTRPPRKGGHVDDIRKISTQVSTLLSALANAGHDDFPTAIHAFDAAKRQLPPNPPEAVCFQPPETDWIPLGEALDALSPASPRLKKHILAACVAAVSHDGEIRIEEAELVRTVAHAIDLPMPTLS